jgi:hypothetical protein
MEVENHVQKTIKVSSKGYNRLEMLRDMLGEFYQKKMSFEDAILWLIVKSAIPIHDLNNQLTNRRNELRSIDNPLEVRTALEEILASRASPSSAHPPHQPN